MPGNDLEQSITTVSKVAMGSHKRIDLLLGPGGSTRSLSSEGQKHTLFKNFERLSGLINESTKNKQRAAQVEKLKKSAKARFRIERRANARTQNSKFFSDL